MNSGLQKRLYEMEVVPPAAVWEKLSANIDEINADNALSTKVLNVGTIPPAHVWEKINATINVAEEKQPQKKAVVINLRRLAAAAIFIGIIAAAWILIRNNNQRSAGLALETPDEKNTTADTNSTRKNNSENPKTIDTRVDQPSVNTTLASVTPQSGSVKTRKNNFTGRNRNSGTPKLVKEGQLIALNTTLGKSFDQPIDDLSRVTADQHYMTMVSSNGRLIKIPAQLAHLAPHLQDKPISEDINEIMFGEGTYWKETLTEWRKKIASAPVASGDAFTSFVELLKTIQDK